MVLFTGPAGSGKNTLIDVYCKENDITVLKFIYENESKFYDMEADHGIRKD